MIGDVIRQYRYGNHLSQAQMAELLDVSPSYVSSLERGVRNAEGRQYAVSYAVLKKMASVMGVPLTYLEKEARQQPDYLKDPLTDEETDLIMKFRNADPETKAMIRRLLQYMKTEESGNGKNYS